MAKQEVKNEIAVKTMAPPPAVYEPDNSKSIIDTADILIPRLLIVQNGSRAFSEGRAMPGDLYNSLTGSVVADVKTDLPFIPIHMIKFWRRFEFVDGNKKWRGTVPFVEGVELPREEMITGQDNKVTRWQNFKTLEVFGFTVEDAGDPTSLPSVISFSSTQYENGRKFSTHFGRIQMANKTANTKIPPYAYKLLLTRQKTTKDSKTWYKLDVINLFENGKPAQTPPEFLSKLQHWTEFVSSSSVKVDNNNNEDTASNGAEIVIPEGF